MPRPISSTTRNPTGRGHYERKEIESLFQVQPRAAQLLLEMLPTTVIGRSRLRRRCRPPRD
jgi:hypothetical protein